MIGCQETFDRVAKHLLKQNKKSVNGTQCMYRSSDGLQCALGCLIPDELYVPSLEGTTLRTSTELRNIFADYNHDLLHSLQRVCMT